MVPLREIVAWLDQTLEVARIKDVAQNGLQVEGNPEVGKVVTGVSANLALLKAAVEANADLVVVHHGLVWGGIRRVVGPMRQRLALLLSQEVSLAAYHIPLDLHPTLGNNAGLVRVLGLEEVEPFGTYKGEVIGLRGVLPQAEMLELFVERVMRNIHPEPRVFEGGNQMIERVAVCSGGAPELVDEAIEHGCDLFLTGEAAEYTPALAAEGGIHIVAAGHHATEVFGVRALAEELPQRFSCKAQFIDIPNAL